MDILTLLISRVNDVLWTYILIIMLLGCAFWFTFKTNFVQFRMIREMIRLLGDSTGKTEGREHHISSFLNACIHDCKLLKMNCSLLLHIG